jgi:riboflavin kinase/FMN adenylyltransferase
MRGRQLANQLGFPTANVSPEADLLPPFGVYAVKTEIEGREYSGIANLGVRPTVETAEASPSLEVHVFDWNGDLYGQSLEVKLGDFIRPEQKFTSIDALKKQIEADVTLARSM